MTDIFDKKSSAIFNCKICNYITSRKSQYNRHLLTPKHQNTDKILTNTDIEGSKSSATYFSCNCGKIYKHRQSLFTHKKKCLTKCLSDDKDSLKINEPVSYTHLTLPTSDLV